MTRAVPTYLDDSPSSPPEFDFDIVAAALANVLVRPSDGATVIGIHGPWGSGKTTLMLAVRDAAKALLKDKRPLVVEFNAWKFQSREALWRALILHLVGELRRHSGEDKKLDELESSLYRAFEVQEKGPWSINWRTAITELASLILGVLQLDVVGKVIRGSSSVLRRLFGRDKPDDAKGVVDDKDLERLAGILERATVKRHVDQVRSIEQFLDRFRKIVEELTRDGRRVLVLVDDLDRCLPESALEIFESIKLFLDASGCGFVVAVDREIIRRGLAVRYAALQQPELLIVDPDEYIEKTIAVSFDVPRLSHADATALVTSLPLALPLTGEDQALIAGALARNPRRIKRFMNLLAIQADLASMAADKGRSVPAGLGADGADAERATMLKLLLIGYRYPGVLRAAAGDPDLVVRLQKISRLHDDKAGANPEQARSERDQKLESEVPVVAALRSDPGFWTLMGSGPNLAHSAERIGELVDWFRQSGIHAQEEPRIDSAP